MSLKFKCPKCSHDHLNEITTNVKVTCLIEEIADDGDVSYGDETHDLSDSSLDSYQCSNCGFILKTEGEKVDDADSLVEWLNANVEQENCS